MVWGDCAVSDNSLTRSFALLRRLLGDNTREPRFIGTVPTVGYRFLCDVKVVEDGFGGPRKLVCLNRTTAMKRTALNLTDYRDFEVMKPPHIVLATLRWLHLQWARRQNGGK